MVDHRGFLKVRHARAPAQPARARSGSWTGGRCTSTAWTTPDAELVVRRQAGRCMDCGIPFCHQGCPLGNLIPDWNDLTRAGQWGDAIERLHATNNFPEFTGRICPAPCESACVLGINQDPVTIKNVEVTIAEEAFGRGLVTPQVPARPHRQHGRRRRLRPGGPRRRAAADPRRAHRRGVRARRRRRRPAALRRAGLQARQVGHRPPHRADGRRGHPVPPGRGDRPGHHLAAAACPVRRRHRRDRRDRPARPAAARAASSPASTRRWSTCTRPTPWSRAAHVPDQVVATGKHVVIIGGGDTGSDCLGTALRQGAASVTTLAIGKQPPTERPPHQPWPMDPTVFEVSSSHEEGGERDYLASTVAFEGDDDGRVTGLRVATTEYLPDGRRVPAVRHGAGHPGRPRPRRDGLHRCRRSTSLAAQTGVAVTPRGVVARGGRLRDEPARACSSPGTPDAGSRSSSGRSPRAAPRRRPSTRTCPAGLRAAGADHARAPCRCTPDPAGVAAVPATAPASPARRDLPERPPDDDIGWSHA